MIRRGVLFYISFIALVLASENGFSNGQQPASGSTSTLCQNALLNIIGNSLAGKSNSEIQEHQIPNLRPVREQCSGTCWLNASLTEYEYLLAAQGIMVPHLSADYLMAQKLTRDTCAYAANGPKYSKLPNLDGDNPSALGVLAHRYGLVPDTLFPYKPVGGWNKIIGQLKVYAKQAWSRREAGEDFVKIRDEARTWAKQLIESEIGPFPRSFEVDGKTWTPETYSKYLESQNSFHKEYAFFLSPDAASHSMKYDSRYLVEMIMDPAQKILERIKQNILLKRSTLVSLRWAGQLENNNGVLKSNPNIRIPVKATPETVEHDLHAILVVGYREQDGKLTHLKLQNSWGTENGLEGFNIISVDDFFRVFHSMRDFTARK
ncbi:MAG: hypothetical protein AABZ06_06725 [Bdellovibrionota bacterium]